MNTWPVEYLECINDQLLNHLFTSKITVEQFVNRVLQNLSEAGLLKDPPQPREIWWCPACGNATETPQVDGSKHYCDPNGVNPIKMREIIE